MTSASGIVIIGAGQAGFATAAKLRALGDSRPVTILGAEDVLPYQRPPLSKKYLLEPECFDRLLFRPEAWYAQHNIDIRLRCSATSIDRSAKRVTLSDGSTIGYDQLVLATGASPRRIPADIGGNLDGVFSIRSKQDVDCLRSKTNAGKKLLVIGGGYIGLETAAVARTLGLRVTLLEASPRILQRVAAPETADTIRSIHTERGVTIKEGVAVERLIGRNGHLCAAVLSDGSAIDADLAIVGIGAVPDDQLAADAGLETANGIVVDAYTRTSDPSIFAVGDCVSLPLGGMRVRLESVQNAIDQAEVAALVIAGQEVQYSPKPWFWSDQYEVKLQIAGLSIGSDETIVRPGSRERSQSVWYFRNGEFVAVEAVNDAKAYAVGKRLLDAGRQPNKSILTDIGSDLKALI